MLRLPRRLPHCHSHLGLIPLRSGDCLSRRVTDGSMHFAVDDWWSNQVQPPNTLCEVVFQKEQRVVRVALFLSRTLRHVVGLLPTLVPLNSFVVLPARSRSRDCKQLISHHQDALPWINNESSIQPDAPLPCAKCEPRNNGESARNTRLDDTGWTRRNTWMLCYVVSFLMARYRTAIRA